MTLTACGHIRCEVYDDCQLRAVEGERTMMWRDLVEDKGIDQANRDWPRLDPERGGPGYHRGSETISL